MLSEPRAGKGMRAARGRVTQAPRLVRERAVQCQRAAYEEAVMAAERSGGNTGGIGLGGIFVIVGIVLMIVWSFWIGLIIALVGLIAFGGFARGKWY
jgi:hypothetical protein